MRIQIKSVQLNWSINRLFDCSKEKKHFSAINLKVVKNLKIIRLIDYSITGLLE